MSSLVLLKELQSTLDLLRTIERDLAAFPPDLAKADAEAKALQVQTDKARAALVTAEKPRAQAQAVYDQAKKIEVSTRAHLKETQHQIPYAEALRELGEKERAVTAAAKPLKELDAVIAARKADLDALEPRLADAKAQFESLHAIFLAEHENQVVVRGQLETKRTDLWTAMDEALKPRVERLISQRQGKLIAEVAQGICGGCHTKLRGPLVTQLRHPEGLIPCETCQRYLYLA